MGSLYCIFARAADRAVIFRRGPTHQVRLISWNMKDNSFEPGQWFNGRIYERKSDLSPDGTKLVYFAAKHKPPNPTWVAISSPPFLTAHLLWPKSGTYDGPSLFESANVLGLGVYSCETDLTPRTGDQAPPGFSVVARPYLGYFYRREDHDRMVRDDWSVFAGEPKYRSDSDEAPVLYRKKIDSQFAMEMRAFNRVTHYGVRDANGNLIALNADWADTRGGRMYFSRDNKLFQMEIGTADPVEIGDFTDMRFEEIAAPDWAKSW